MTSFSIYAATQALHCFQFLATLVLWLVLDTATTLSPKTEAKNDDALRTGKQGLQLQTTALAKWTKSKQDLGVSYGVECVQMGSAKW